VEQARSGPRVVSYLPYYYSFLQFAKAVIVARQGVAALSSPLTHGLSYRPTAKDSQSLENEEIYVWTKGVFQIFYEILTRRELPDLRPKAKRTPYNPRMAIKMQKVYPYLYDAEHEYLMAKQETKSYFAWILIEKILDDADSPLKLKPVLDKESVTNANLSPLFRRLGIEGDLIEIAEGVDPHAEIPTYLLCHTITVPISRIEVPPFWYGTPIWNGRLHYAEEIPIFLAFFHLGSIARYKPRFMERIMDSPYYPFILAVERHCATKMFLLFYESMMQCSYIIESH
jgi:hypothetical protein